MTNTNPAYEEHQALMAENERLKAEKEKLLSQLAKYKEALEFYASGKHISVNKCFVSVDKTLVFNPKYNAGCLSGSSMQAEERVAIVINDHGEVARQALSQGEDND